MSRLPELHRQLVQAARQQDAREHELGWLLRLAGRRHGSASAAPPKRIASLRIPTGRLHLLVLSFTVVVLASTTIALAASGVIPIGSPVSPDRHLKPNVGIGLPKAGNSQLLPLRVSDPAGGPPWGMRVIRTSREEVCLQIGRVQAGKLGVLGVGGAFNDDGRFHPLPLDALPARALDLGGFLSTTTSCFLAGRAFIDSHIAMPISALGESTPGRRTSPSKDLRDVYYGMLGPQALGIAYPQDGAQRTQAVLPATGAYLIVQPFSASELRAGGASSGPLGQLAPSRGELLTSITYRLNGETCERGLQNARTRLAHPCPESAGPRRTELSQRHARRELHVPLHVHLQIHHGLVTSAYLSFRAPYTIQSARHYYSVFLPEPTCHPRPGEESEEGGVSDALERNVAAGETVSARVIYPFLPIRHPCVKARTTIEILFRDAEDPQRTVVGKITLRQPPGTRGGPNAKPLGP